jgi:hypothetical protein
VINQLSAVIGVAVGAVLSYLVGMLNERTRWGREQGARWDGLLLKAYSDYGQAIKECVVAYGRLAAHQGLTEVHRPSACIMQPASGSGGGGPHFHTIGNVCLGSTQQASQITSAL